MKTGLWQFLKKFFKKQVQQKKTTDTFPNYDYDLLKMHQDFDDAKLEREARQVAWDMFDQWQKGNCIIIQKPITMFIKEHYPLKSRYDSESYSTLVKKEFEKLKEDYIQKYGNPRNGCLQYGRK